MNMKKASVTSAREVTDAFSKINVAKAGDGKRKVKKSIPIRDGFLTVVNPKRKVDCSNNLRPREDRGCGSG